MSIRCDSERISTSPASAAPVAGETRGGSAAWAVAARAVTSTSEMQVLEVIAEVDVRIDRTQVQCRCRAFAWLQPRLRVVAQRIPAQQPTLLQLQHGTLQPWRSVHAEAQAVPVRAQRCGPQPGITVATLPARQVIAACRLRGCGRRPLVARRCLRRSVSLQFGQVLHRRARIRSEEHTSELQSQSNLVCRLLLEK